MTATGMFRNIGSLYASSDGGKTAANITVGNYDTMATAQGQDMDWADAEHGFIVRASGGINGVQPGIVATVDGGRTWVQTPTGDEASALEHVDVVSPTAGWAVGNRGAIYTFQAAR